MVAENGSIMEFDKKGRMISVEIPFRGGCPMDIQSVLPKSQRTFWSPETCTFVGYSRAKQLGLNTDMEEPPVYIPGEEHKLYIK